MTDTMTDHAVRELRAGRAVGFGRPSRMARGARDVAGMVESRGAWWHRGPCLVSWPSATHGGMWDAQCVNDATTGADGLPCCHRCAEELRA